MTNNRNLLLLAGDTIVKPRFERILVVVSSTRGRQAALERAIVLGRSYRCPVEAFVCIYDPYIAGERFADSEGLEKAREALKVSTGEWLKDHLSEMDSQGVELSTHVGWGSPLCEAVLARAAAIGADLIVKDAHHHPHLERALFSNTDWNLLRGFEDALWLVKAGEWPEHPVIMAAVDPVQEHERPHNLDLRILDVASSVKEVFSGDLHVVHAYPSISNSVLAISAIPGAAGFPLEISEDVIVEEHREALEELIAGHAAPGTEVHFVSGSPRDVILEHRKITGANVVVMGVVARGILKRLMLGSTAEQVLDLLSCDVLAVRAAEDE